MNKERLKEIKEQYDWTVTNGLQPRIDDSELEWLIEQSERVQELEKENRLLRFIAEENKIAYEQRAKQNKHYREAKESAE